MDTLNQIEEETEISKSKKVSCSGVGGSLGHPKIYLDTVSYTHLTLPTTTSV